MSRIAQRLPRRRRLWRMGAVVVVAVGMWTAGAAYFTGGMLDLAVFAPPGAALGLAAVWSAHVFTPSAFTWRRSVAGALVGGLIVGPLAAFLVAFSASWDPASFQLVFNVGALLAFAAGFAVGGIHWLWAWVRTVRRLRRRRLRTGRRSVQCAAMPDARNGVRPTLRPAMCAYPVARVHPS